MDKQGLTAISVTTEEAFGLCLAEGILLIAVEAPLYPEIKEHWTNFEGIDAYDFTEYPKLNCVILKKVRGTNFFDNEKHEIFYFPFHNL